MSLNFSLTGFITSFAITAIEKFYGDRSGRWTYCLIPELDTCLDRKHAQVGFYLAQALSGHGCFNAYLKRFKKRDDESCSYCGSLVDNAEHTLFVDRCLCRQFQTLILQSNENEFKLYRIWNLSVEKKTLSTAIGFEPRPFDCRSTALTTALHRLPTSPSPQENLLISPSGSALRL